MRCMETFYFYLVLCCNTVLVWSSRNVLRTKKLPPTFHQHEDIIIINIITDNDLSCNKDQLFYMRGFLKCLGTKTLYRSSARPTTESTERDKDGQKSLIKLKSKSETTDSEWKVACCPLQQPAFDLRPPPTRRSVVNCLSLLEWRLGI